MAASLSCCGGDRWSSSETRTGYGDATKAERAIAANTDSAEMRDVSVWPCSTSGSPPAPSQQSTSMQRHPCSSTRSYMPASDADVSWPPVR